MMKKYWIIIIVILSFDIDAQELEYKKINSVEQATNIVLDSIKKQIGNVKIVISYEYIYKIDSLNTNDKIKVIKDEINFNNLKKGNSIYLLKLYIDIKSEIFLYPIFYEVRKKNKNNLVFTTFSLNLNDFIILTDEKSPDVADSNSPKFVTSE